MKTSLHLQSSHKNAALTQKTLRLEGMACAACATTIETTINKISGVKKCNVNFALERATVDYDNQVTNLETIQFTVSKAGYKAYVLEESSNKKIENLERQKREKKQQELTQKVVFGSIISFILIFGSLPMMTGLSIPLFPIGYITLGYSYF